MRLLLDTHVWVWTILSPGRLAKRAADTLTSAESERFLSPISVWEVMLLIEKKRLRIEGETESWVRTALAGPLREISLSHEVALWSRRVRLPHEDPADRFLVATAKVHELTLVTADRRLLGARACRTLAAR